MNKDVKYRLVQSLLQGLGHVATAGQQSAVNKIADYLLADNSRTAFVLKGYAGTGKTTLMGAVAKVLPSIKQSAVFLAPTGRAAKVLGSATRHRAYTIHKKIYFSELRDGKFVTSLAVNRHKNTLFVVDESSMIPDYSHYSSSKNTDGRSLLEDLLAYVWMGTNCKVLLVGDGAQLPPVGEDQSPGLNARYLTTSYQVTVIEHELTEVVRQAWDSGVLSNATALRQDLHNDSDGASGFPIIDHANFPDIIRIEGSGLQDELESNYDKFGQDGCIVVCRSNKRAGLFNQQVRGRILWREEELSSEDRLMVVKNNYFWLEPNSKAGFIANGDMLEVIRVLRFEQLYGFQFADCIVRMVDYPEEPEQELKLILNSLHSEQASLSRDDLKRLFYEIELDYSDIKNKRARFRKILTSPYFNAVQIKYGYAITCHKSQGGQWPVVFIDQGFLTEQMMDKQYKRWLYTAFTRASEKLYLINFHPKFFESET